MRVDSRHMAVVVMLDMINRTEETKSRKDSQQGKGIITMFFYLYQCLLLAL